MTNTTATTARKQWNCELCYEKNFPRGKTSSTFSVSKLKNPQFTISVIFHDRATLSVEVKRTECNSTSQSTGLCKILVQVHALFNMHNQASKSCKWTRDSGTIEWENDQSFTFEEFSREFRNLQCNRHNSKITVKRIDCEVIWYGTIQEMPLMQPSMSDMEFALMNPQFSDVTLEVGDEKLPAHKIILANYSPVFAAMFATPMRESLENRIVIQDASADAVKTVLKYLYTGDACDLQEVGIIWDVLNIARKYELTILQEYNEKKLIKFLTIDDVMSMLDNIHDSNTVLLYDIMLKYDCTLSDQSPVHRVEFSQFMRKIFEERIYAQGVDMDIIKVALTFWYSGESVYFVQILWDVFNIARVHNIKACRNFCEEILRTEVNAKNVVEMLRNADTFFSEAVYHRALDLAISRRLEISQCTKFKELCLQRPTIAVDFLEYSNLLRLSKKIEDKKQNTQCSRLSAPIHISDPEQVELRSGFFFLIFLFYGCDISFIPLFTFKKAKPVSTFFSILNSRNV